MINGKKIDGDMSKNIESQYLKLLKDILENGVEKQDRTGTGTISVFGRQIRHNMSKGFPLLTTKKMYWKGIVTELLWFLRGETNIKYLVDNDCHIWDGDAYKNYVQTMDNKRPAVDISEYGDIDTNGILTIPEFIEKIKTDDEFAKKWGELGPIYGKQWRDWQGFQQGWNAMADTEYPGEFDTKGTDQIQNLIEQLKTNPDSRRLMVSSWNVGELDRMTLPPCHYGFQVYTRELSLDERNKLNWDVPKEVYTGMTHEQLDKFRVPTRAISLMWNQRSVDTFLGLPFNIASYGLLLEIIAKEVNMVPDELIGNLGDVHLYKNHIEQVKEQLAEIPWEERREMLTDPSDIREFGNISPFTDKMIHSWLDYKKIPNSRRMPYPLPRLLLDYSDGEYNKNLKDFVLEDFVLFDYKSHPPIKAPLSN